MKLAIYQMHARPNALNENFNALVEQSKKASSEACALFVAPELALTGPAMSRAILNESYVDEMNTCLHRLRKELPNDVFCIIGAPFVERANGEDRVSSAAYCYYGGKITGIVKKTRANALKDERRYCAYGNDAFPHRVFKVHKNVFAITFDDDFFGNEIPRRRFYRPVDYYIALAASPWQAGGQMTRRERTVALCNRLGAPVVYVNHAGYSPPFVFDGRSCIVRKGKIVHESRAFEETLTMFDFMRYEKCPPETITKPDDMFLAYQSALSKRMALSRADRAVLFCRQDVQSALALLFLSRALGKERVHALCRESEKDALAPLFRALALTGEAVESASELEDAFFLGAAKEARPQSLVIGMANRTLCALGRWKETLSVEGAFHPFGDATITELSELLRVLCETNDLPLSAAVRGFPFAASAPLSEDDGDYATLDALMVDILQRNKERDALMKKYPRALITQFYQTIAEYPFRENGLSIIHTAKTSLL